MLAVIFGYIGPETTLPMMSVVASALGIVLMFGRYLLNFAKSCARVIQGKNHAELNRWRQPPVSASAEPAQSGTSAVSSS